MRFADREAAGAQLADALEGLANEGRIIVYGLPRGGVPTAYPVAVALDAPLDTVIVRKVGVPGRRELAMGAVASGNVTILDDRIIESLNVPTSAVERAVRDARAEVVAREQRFGAGHRSPSPRDAIAVVIDDGMATGSTMKASVMALQQRSARQVIVAVPVASARARTELEVVADRVVCLATPDPFVAVGAWYDDFAQVPDHEVVRLLDAARN